MPCPASLRMTARGRGCPADAVPGVAQRERARPFGEVVFSIRRLGDHSVVQGRTAFALDHRGDGLPTASVEREYAPTPSPRRGGVRHVWDTDTKADFTQMGSAFRFCPQWLAPYTGPTCPKTALSRCRGGAPHVWNDDGHDRGHRLGRRQGAPLLRAKMQVRSGTELLISLEPGAGRDFSSRITQSAHLAPRSVRAGSRQLIPLGPWGRRGSPTGPSRSNRRSIPARVVPDSSGDHDHDQDDPPVVRDSGAGSCGGRSRIGGRRGRRPGGRRDHGEDSE
jgi:hypothetical protein